MTLDVPTWAADELNSPKTGLKSLCMPNKYDFWPKKVGQTRWTSNIFEKKCAFGCSVVTSTSPRSSERPTFFENV